MATLRAASITTAAMVQIWATRDLEEATPWIETQPEHARTAQLRARSERVRGDQTVRAPEPN